MIYLLISRVALCQRQRYNDLVVAINNLEIEMKGKTSKTRKVVNEIAGMSTYNKGAFIDRIDNDVLSLKVWGWGEATYDLCANKLRELGCDVIKRTYRFKNNRFVQHRLWVREN